VRVGRLCGMAAALLACHQGKQDAVKRVEPASYGGPPVPSTVIEPGSSGAALVGAVFDCDGRPLASVLLNGRRVDTAVAGTADTLVRLVDSTFSLSPLSAGDWQFRFLLIGYTTRLIPFRVHSSRTDTLMVQMSENPLAIIGDCFCANGDFGSQCCKPENEEIHQCSPGEPTEPPDSAPSRGGSESGFVSRP
jgi:hypothetical protein